MYHGGRGEANAAFFQGRLWPVISILQCTMKKSLLNLIHYRTYFSIETSYTYLFAHGKVGTKCGWCMRLRWEWMELITRTIFTTPMFANISVPSFVNSKTWLFILYDMRVVMYQHPVFMGTLRPVTSPKKVVRSDDDMHDSLSSFLHRLLIVWVLISVILAA